MILSEIGKNAAGKFQTIYSLLMNGMRTDLHKCIFATIINHHSKKLIQCDRVERRVGSRIFFFVDIITYRRQQSHGITLTAKHFIK